MVMDIRKCVLLAKAETTYDTDPTPTGASNSILAQDVDIKENIGVIERNAQWKFLGQLPSLEGDKMVEISFKVPVIGSGTAGTAPRVGCLIQACGHLETVSGGVSVTYSPVSSGHGSVTIYIYKDGRLHIATGCRGSFKLMYSAAKELMMEFTFMGRYAAPTVSALPSVTYESTVKVPPVCKSSTFTYNSKTTLVVGSFELDAGAKAVKRVSLSDANGVAGFEITDRSPKFTLDPEGQFQTSFDFRGDRLTTTRSISVIATRAAGNIITTTVPQALITKIEYGDRDGILIEKIEGECSDSTTGDDSYSIVFT